MNTERIAARIAKEIGDLKLFEQALQWVGEADAKMQSAGTNLREQVRQLGSHDRKLAQVILDAAKQLDNTGSEILKLKRLLWKAEEIWRKRK